MGISDLLNVYLDSQRLSQVDSNFEDVCFPKHRR